MKYIRIFALVTYGFIAGVYFVNSFLCSKQREKHVYVVNFKYIDHGPG